jgi:hypothetical protein
MKVLWEGMSHRLNETQRRQYAAMLSKAYGYGGAAVVHLENWNYVLNQHITS